MGDRDVQPGERIVPGARLGRLRLVTLSGPTEVPATGRLTHLQFRRFAGCPVCDLHLRSFVRRHDEIERAGITEIVFFHSRESELRAHAAGLPFLLVADPARRWYARFRVGASRRALLDPRAWFYVVLGVARSLLRVVCGRQPMPPLVPEGGSLGLPADFLIGSDGAVLACNYGEHVYDQWSVADLLRLGARVDEAAADRGSSMR